MSLHIGIIIIAVLVICRLALFFVKGSGPLAVVVKAIGEAIKTQGKLL